MGTHERRTQNHITSRRMFEAARVPSPCLRYAARRRDSRTLERAAENAQVGVCRHTAEAVVQSRSDAPIASLADSLFEVTKQTTRRRAMLGLLWSGLLLLLPMACYVGEPQPVGPEDLVVAATPVARLPLTGLRSGGPVRLSFQIPDSTQWARIRRHWGPPRYLVFAVDNTGTTILPFASLHVSVDIRGRHGALVSERSTGRVHNYSQEHQDTGLRFDPQVGDELQLQVETHHTDTLPDGELIVEPYLESFTKDDAVGVGVAELFKTVFTWSALVGIALLFAAAVLATFNP
jgi:hypothetical protein